jgi:phosphoglycerate dehydrogenase-like enzyme
MRLLFCHQHYAPNLSWDAMKALLPGHEILSCSRHEIVENLEGVDILVPFAASIRRPIIEQGTFGLIHEFAVGLDTIDIETATRAGVWVAHLPASTTGNADSVAEVTLLHMLLLARRWKASQTAFAERRIWEPLGGTLLGRTAGVIGLGDLGTAIAKRLQALGMQLIGVRRHPEQGGPEDVSFRRIVGMDALHEVLREVDYVILCLPATRETHHLFSAETFAAMKPGGFLINIGRGTLVDQDALLDALRSGHLGGAGLDVFWEEPVDPQHPLFQQNVMVTPHIGGITDTSFWLRARAFAANIQRYAQNQALLYAVNCPPHPRVILSSEQETNL